MLERLQLPNHLSSSLYANDIGVRNRVKKLKKILKMSFNFFLLWGGKKQWLKVKNDKVLEKCLQNAL